MNLASSPQSSEEGSRTSEQMRAGHALKIIKELRDADQSQSPDGKGPTPYGNFRAYVENLPALIVMNGLGQALASELAMARIGDNGSGNLDLSGMTEALQGGRTGPDPDEWAHQMLFCIVQDWLQSCKVYSEMDLMEALTSGSQTRYVRAQAETLAYLEWLKKFSQAFLRKGVRGEGDGGRQ